MSQLYARQMGINRLVCPTARLWGLAGMRRWRTVVERQLRSLQASGTFTGEY
jgi:hypothetical protein